MANQTILLYGRTRAGKTTLIGELAESEFKRTGKKTRLYTIDRGGAASVQPYVELGLIELVEQGDSNPWIFLNNAVNGRVRNEKGEWIAPDNSGVGVFAFESMTAFADALMSDLAEKSAQNQSIGGQANVNFTISGDNQTLKVGGSNMAHYNIVQTRITNEVWTSQRLPGEYVIWTASVSKDDDQVSVGKVLGPAVVGKALTAEVPRWFGLTFRVDCLPAQQGKPERHVLYLGNSSDAQAGNAVTLGNTRTPLDSTPLPSTLEPASLVAAIQMIQGGAKTAIDKIKARIGAAMNQQKNVNQQK